MKTYAAYYDNEVRKFSSSGGIFSLLAKQFAVVYGVAMTEDCYGAEYIRVENGNILPLRGSKYFQAKVGETFKQVKKDLEEGRQVLFTGTGCQINGLQMFLQKKYSNLFLLDVICHGTPSPKLWREYVKNQESKHGKLEYVNFRCKDDSWNNFGMKENQMYISKDKDSFMRMFLRDYCLRPACYECHAKYYKNADMTIADFWGIENVAPEMNDGMGISLVITRTEKGQKIFDNIKTELKWKEVSYEEGVRNNMAEYSSAIRPKERDTFFNDLSIFTFEELEKKYAADVKESLFRRAVSKVKGFVKKIFDY
ncbi:MAG: Coenzyme F420 hydrogenase/dehydrogenase, beta subunit C-terminal domain [Lachnospira sp.]